MWPYISSYIRVWLTHKLCECSAAKINTSKNRVHTQIKSLCSNNQRNSVITSEHLLSLTPWHWYFIFLFTSLTLQIILKLVVFFLKSISNINYILVLDILFNIFIYFLLLVTTLMYTVHLHHISHPSCGPSSRVTM